MKLKEILVTFEQQKIDLSKDILFIEFMKMWLENLKYSIASTTYDIYRLVLNTHIFPYFEPQKLKVRDLTPSHIQRYVSFKLEKLSPNTVRKHLANISKCLDSAVRQSMIPFNPITVIRISKEIHKQDSTKNSSSYAVVPLPDMIKKELKK